MTATTTTVHCSVDEFVAEYTAVAPLPPLHESVSWLRYCERRSTSGMRYVLARGQRGELLGITALRVLANRSMATANYDVVSLVWPLHEAPPPVPVEHFYPQLFAAVSGVHCLFRSFDKTSRAGTAEIRTALARATAVLADRDSSVLTFAYLPDAGVASDLAAQSGAGEHALIGAEAVLDGEWRDFDDYIGFLPRRRRCQVRRERSSYLASGLVTSVHETAAVLDERAALLQELVVTKYGLSSSVSATLDDYDNLSSTVDDHVLVFTAHRDRVLVGVSICLRDGDTLHVRCGGFDHAATPHTFTYFNLMFYEPLLWGLRNGIRHYRFGSGSHVAKRRRGCRLATLHAVVRWPPALAEACGGALSHREFSARAELGMDTSIHTAE